MILYNLKNKHSIGEEKPVLCCFLLFILYILSISVAICSRKCLTNVIYIN